MMIPHRTDFNRASEKTGKGIDAPLDAAGHTALHLSIRKGDVESAAKLLKMRANPHQPDKSGQPPIYTAIAARNIKLVKLLVEYGASFRIEDSTKRSPLMWAIEEKCEPSFLKQLCELGMTLDFQTKAGRHALHTAATANRPEIVDFLVESGLPIDLPAQDGKTALHAAVESKAYEAVRKLLNVGANPLTRTKELKTPLYLAAAVGDAKAVDILLAQPSVRQTVDNFLTMNEGFTPLMAAITANQTEIAEKLISLGANINHKDSRNRQPLFLAVEAGHVDMVQMLIRNGADVDKAHRAPKNAEPMLHSINKAHYDELLLILYAAGADMNVVDRNGQSALMRAIEMQESKKIKSLLQLGADPNLADAYGARPIDKLVDYVSYAPNGYETVRLLLDHRADPNLSPLVSVQEAPLHKAVREGDEKLVKMLLEHGAIADQPSRTDGLTPWMVSLESSMPAISNLLVEKGADVLKKDSMGRCALHLAAQQETGEVLKKLLLIPALAQEINTKDLGGATPLHMAVSAGAGATCVKMLLAAGADPLIRDIEGMTPLHLAAVNGGDDSLAVFEKALGAKLDWNIRTTESKETMLHLAVKNNMTDMVEHLLKRGADATIKNAEGETAMDLAKELEAEDMINLLKKAQQKPSAKKPPSPKP